MGSLFPRLFPKKNRRAEELMHQKNEESGEAYDPEKLPLEKGDFFSMLLSAFLVILPVAVALLLFMALVAFVFFRGA